MNSGALDAAVRAVARRSPGTLAVAVRGEGLAYGHADGERLTLASTGKLVLLAETARRIDDGTLDPAEPVEVRADEVCGGTGLLTALTARRWPVADLAVLVAAVSDNTATNALLRHVGRDAVNAGAAALGARDTVVLDRIRDERGPADPPAFAVGTAGDLAGLAARVGAGTLWTPGASALVLRWLSGNTDHTLVPALLPHDPYQLDRPTAPAPADVWVAAKTGTDTGVRAEVGVMIARRRVGYAVIAVGEPGTEPGLVGALRETGLALARHAAGWLG
jgi:beta-lactamase class A